MTEANHWVALEAGPYFWNADTIYDFLKDLFGIIKPAVDRIRNAENSKKNVDRSKQIEIENSLEEKELEDFVKKLSEQSKKVFGDKKWVDLMGTYIFIDDKWVVEEGSGVFDILKCNEKGKDQMHIDKDESKKACVVQLLRLIRHKIQHMSDYTDEVKNKLPMFFGGDEDTQKLTFRERFVTYWITRFPSLVSFLWVKFYKFREDLKRYYPVQEVSIGNDFSLMPIDKPNDSHVNLIDVVNYIPEALNLHLEKGTVLKRFKQIDGPCLLEFRAFHGLLKILDKSSFISAKIISRGDIQLDVSHSTSQHKLVYVSQNDFKNEDIIIIFTENVESNEVWRDCYGCICKVVVFCDEEKTDDQKIINAVDQFKAINVNVEIFECPITGLDLTASKRNSLFENGHVCIQGNQIKIKDIFSARTADEICGELGGNFLNQILRFQVPSLFAHYEFPPVDDIYVERSLYINGNLRVNKAIVDISKCGKLSVPILFVTCGFSKEQMYCLQKESCLWYNVDNLSNVFYQKGSEYSKHFHDRVAFLNLQPPETEIPHQILATSRILRDKPECIHYLFCDESNQLCYRVSKSLNVNIIRDFNQGFETILLQNVFNENNKSVFIMADPGGGKTNLLKSLGTKIIENHYFGLVIFQPFGHFVNQLETEINHEATIGIAISVKKIIQKLLCRDDFEKQILNNWLDQKVTRNKNGIINLMLDGLDEVPMSSITLAVNTLQVIQNEIKTIRLWITSRQPFPGESYVFTYDTVQMLPFTNDEQRTFFVKYFKKHKPNNDANQLASKCSSHIKNEIETQLKSQITTTPLHCNLIAELFDQAMTSSRQHEEGGSLLNKLSLYEGILKKKIYIYINEKLAIPLTTNKSFLQQNEDCLFEIHMYLALEYFVPGKFNEPKIARRYKLPDYLEMGIIQCLDPLTFVHQTFAEYLTARFIYQKLLLVDDNEKINYNLISINDLLAETFSYSTVQKDFVHNVTCNFLNEMLKQCKLDSMTSLQYHHLQHPNLEKVLKILDSKMYCTYSSLIHLAFRVCLHKLDAQFYCKALVTAINSRPPENSLDTFIELIHIFELNDKHLCTSNPHHYQILETVLEKRYYDILKYLIETKGWFPPQTWSSISKMRKNGGGMYHIVIQPIFLSRDDHEESYKEIFRLLKFLHETEKLHVNIEADKMVHVRDNHGKTVLMSFPMFGGNKYITIRKFIVEELGADVNACISDGRSVLCLVNKSNTDFYYDKEQEVENYHRLLEIFISNGFNQIDSKTLEEGWTGLACAVDHFRSKLPIKTLRLFHSAGFDFNAKDNKGCSILHFCVEFIKDASFAILLIMLGCDISLRNEQSLCSLCLAMDLKNTEMCMALWRMMICLKKEPCGEQCKIKLVKIRDQIEADQKFFFCYDYEIIEMMIENGYFDSFPGNIEIKGRRYLVYYHKGGNKLIPINKAV